MQNEFKIFGSLIIAIFIIALLITFGSLFLSEQKTDQCGINGCIKISCDTSHPLYNSSNDKCYNITTTITFKQQNSNLPNPKKEVTAL